MRDLIVVLGLSLHAVRCSLERATGLFSSHGSERRATRRVAGTIKSSHFRNSTPRFNSNTARCFYTAYFEDSGGHLEQEKYVHAILRVQLQSDDVL